MPESATTHRQHAHPNNDYVFRPEDIRVMGIALDAVLAKLGLNARSDEDAKEAASIVANEIMGLAKDGERDPETLCAGVLECLRRNLRGNSASPCLRLIGGSRGRCRSSMSRPL